MGLVDRAAGWILDFVETHPWLDSFLETHFHAFGLHGPLVRHSLRMRLVPAALVVTATLTLVAVLLAVRAARRALARNRTPAV